MAQQPSYEVVIEGEPVIVPGDALKPMRSKAGYYRLLYQNKLFVLHSSEIRNVDRATDTEEDLTPNILSRGSPGAPPQLPYNPYTAAAAPVGPMYNVKINNTWVKLPLSSVVASRDKPGYYNVSLHGTVYSVSAVNVLPDSYGTQFGNPAVPSQLASPGNGYAANYNTPAMVPPPSSYNIAPPRQQPTYTAPPPVAKQQPTYTATPQVAKQPTYTAPPPPVVQQPVAATVQLPPTRATTVDTVQLPPTRATTVDTVTSKIEEMALSNPPPPSNRASMIRRESYTVETAEQVSIQVGGKWRTIPITDLKPSKKRPGTFIARIDGRSVRLTDEQISPVVGSDKESSPEQEVEKDAFHVFVNGIYMNIKASQLEEADNRPGYKIVILEGNLRQAIHKNFVFQLKEDGEGGLVPIIPDNYRVFLTPEGVIIPKENIKPDASVPNTFMVLVNGVIYKLSAENLQPIIPEEHKEEQSPVAVAQVIIWQTPKSINTFSFYNPPLNSHDPQ
eukprot:sb/3464044/